MYGKKKSHENDNKLYACMIKDLYTDTSYLLFLPFHFFSLLIMTFFSYRFMYISCWIFLTCERIINVYCESLHVFKDYLILMNYPEIWNQRRCRRRNKIEKEEEEWEEKKLTISPMHWWMVVKETHDDFQQMCSYACWLLTNITEKKEASSEQK